MNRSKKIMFVSHCLLNQNARASGMDKAPGPIKDVVELLTESGIGIVQLPCPQIDFNGGPNWKLKPKSTLDNSAYRKHCQKMASLLLQNVEKYLSNGYNVLGFLGVELSATCGVYQIQNGTKNAPGKGILVEELESAMRKKNFQIPIIGVNLNNIYSSIEKVESLLRYS